MRVEKGQAFVQRNLFGGRGEVSVWDLMQGQPAPPFGAVLSCELEGGGRVGAHKQEQLPEVVIGLEGEGEATVDGEVRPLGPGDLVHLPLGSVLTLTNRSATAPLRYLIVKAW